MILSAVRPSARFAVRVAPRISQVAPRATANQGVRFFSFEGELKKKVSAAEDLPQTRLQATWLSYPKVTQHLHLFQFFPSFFGVLMVL